MLNSINAFRVSAVALAGAALTGCVSPNVRVDRARHDLRIENYPAAQAWADGLKTSTFSKELGLLEAGRVHMLMGDFEASAADFDRAIETVMAKNETGPVINLTDITGNAVAGTLTDDRTRPYRIPPYEFIQALNYQMWNHLFLGNPDAARVEARRTVFAQDELAEKYGPAVQRASMGTKYAGTMGAVDARMAPMAPVLEKTRCSYENGLAWYICGILFELDDDAPNARLAYEKAQELSPGPCVERDMLRLLRSEWPEKFDELMARSRLQAEDLRRSPTEIVLVVEENFISQRYSVKIPLPLVGTSATSVDFPMYQEDYYWPMELRLADGAQEAQRMTPALFLQSLAYQDLKEKMPGIVIRNVSRILIRIGAQQAVNHAGNDWGKAIVGFFNLVSAIVNKADVRAWYTLPMVAHVYRGGIEPGEHNLTLTNQANGRSATLPVSVAPGETRFVWVGDIGGQSRMVSASMNGKGAPAAYRALDSLVQWELRK